MDHGDRAARTPVVLLIHEQIGRGEIGEWDDPAGHPSRAEASGIVCPREKPRRTTAGPGPSSACLRAFGPFSLVGTTVLICCWSRN
jgi:hypothetical protein